MISQGDIWWAALPEPVGSGPGFDRPVVIVQGDTFNRSRLATVVVIPLTSNLRLASLPGNILLTAASTGLPKDSVANVTQIIAIDCSLLTEPIGRISPRHLELLWKGLDVLFDR